MTLIATQEANTKKLLVDVPAAVHHAMRIRMAKLKIGSNAEAVTLAIIQWAPEEYADALGAGVEP